MNEVRARIVVLGETRYVIIIYCASLRRVLFPWSLLNVCCAKRIEFIPFISDPFVSAKQPDDEQMFGSFSLFRFSLSLFRWNVNVNGTAADDWSSPHRASNRLSAATWWWIEEVARGVLPSKNIRAPNTDRHSAKRKRGCIRIQPQN